MKFTIDTTDLGHAADRFDLEAYANQLDDMLRFSGYEPRWVDVSEDRYEVTIPGIDLGEWESISGLVETSGVWCSNAADSREAARLTARQVHEEWLVDDPAGGTWVPDEGAQAEIRSAGNASLIARRMAVCAPWRGAWGA